MVPVNWQNSYSGGALVRTEPASDPPPAESTNRTATEPASGSYTANPGAVGLPPVTAFCATPQFADLAPSTLIQRALMRAGFPIDARVHSPECTTTNPPIPTPLERQTLARALQKYPRLSFDEVVGLLSQSYPGIVAYDAVDWRAYPEVDAAMESPERAEVSARGRYPNLKLAAELFQTALAAKSGTTYDQVLRWHHELGRDYHPREGEPVSQRELHWPDMSSSEVETLLQAYGFPLFPLNARRLRARTSDCPTLESFGAQNATVADAIKRVADLQFDHIVPSTWSALRPGQFLTGHRIVLVWQRKVDTLALLEMLVAAGAKGSDITIIEPGYIGADGSFGYEHGDHVKALAENAYGVTWKSPRYRGAAPGGNEESPGTLLHVLKQTISREVEHARTHGNALDLSLMGTPIWDWVHDIAAGTNIDLREIPHTMSDAFQFGQDGFAAPYPAVVMGTAEAKLRFEGTAMLPDAIAHAFQLAAWQSSLDISQAQVVVHGFGAVGQSSFEALLRQGVHKSNVRLCDPQLSSTDNSVFGAFERAGGEALSVSDYDDQLQPGPGVAACFDAQLLVCVNATRGKDVLTEDMLSRVPDGATMLYGHVGTGVRDRALLERFTEYAKSAGTVGAFEITERLIRMPDGKSFKVIDIGDGRVANHAFFDSPKARTVFVPLLMMECLWLADRAAQEGVTGALPVESMNLVMREGLPPLLMLSPDGKSISEEQRRDCLARHGPDQVLASARAPFVVMGTDDIPRMPLNASAPPIGSVVRWARSERVDPGRVRALEYAASSARSSGVRWARVSELQRYAFGFARDVPDARHTPALIREMLREATTPAESALLRTTFQHVAAHLNVGR